MSLVGVALSLALKLKLFEADVLKTWCAKQFTVLEE